MTSTEVHDVFRLAGTTLEGRFIVQRPIAEGGFGVVYYAQQAALERPVALKVLKTPPRFDDEAKQQFLASFAAEAKTIARITHLDSGTYGAAFRAFTGRWEPLPDEGTRDEMIAVVVEEFGPYLDPANYQS